MTSAVLDHARTVARGLEEREQRRHGGSRDEARARLARRIGVLPGTLYTLARNRLKRLDVTVRDRLTDYAIRDLQNEIGRLNHELGMARALGGGAMADRMGEIERHLAAARALMAEAGIGERS